VETLMEKRPDQADPYLAEHVREALAQDPRVGELGVEVEISGETVVLHGTVASAGRQEAAVEVVHGLLPEHEIRDETEVADFPEPTEAEHLP
jgi:osmotically-inducible protein OsmY